MQPDGDDHRVRTPAVHFAHDPERRLFAQVHDVCKCIFDGRPVIKHQQQPGHRLDQEKEEGRSSHAPRVAHAHAGAADFDGMQMENERAEDREDPFAVRVGDADPENGFPDLRIDDAFLQSS
jgi:hypothetical protein